MPKIGQIVTYHLLANHTDAPNGADHSDGSPCACTPDIHAPATVIDIYPAIAAGALADAEKAMSAALEAWAKKPGDLKLWAGVSAATEAVRSAEVAAAQPLALVLDVHFADECYVEQEAKIVLLKEQAAAIAATAAAQLAAAQSVVRAGQDIKKFGAVGDGFTDDSAAVQAAVDAANDAADVLTAAIAADVAAQAQLARVAALGPRDTTTCVLDLPTQGTLTIEAGSIDRGLRTIQSYSPQATTDPPLSGTWTE